MYCISYLISNVNNITVLNVAYNDNHNHTKINKNSKLIQIIPQSDGFIRGLLKNKQD